MDEPVISRPIHIILNGPNYISWARTMTSFLKGCRLWRYVTGDITVPEKEKEEKDDEFVERLEDWESKNYQIITWFHNTCAISIGIQFRHLENAKSVWDYLEGQYTKTDPDRLYQLMGDLCRMRQEPNESINSFYSRMYGIWEQLTLFEPKWECTQDAEKFASYRDQQRLIQFLMGLTDNFYHARVALLHRSPPPTLDSAVTVLISEETRLRFMKLQHSEIDPATNSYNGNSSRSTKMVCRYCKEPGHVLLDCPIRICRFCRELGSGHYQDECFSNPNRRVRDN